MASTSQDKQIELSSVNDRKLSCLLLVSTPTSPAFVLTLGIADVGKTLGLADVGATLGMGTVGTTLGATELGGTMLIAALGVTFTFFSPPSVVAVGCPTLAEGLMSICW